MPTLLERSGTTWLYGGKLVRATFVRDRFNQLEFENEELKQKIAEVEASPSQNDIPATWWQRASFYVGLFVMAVVAAILAWLILRWLFSVNINLTELNLGVVVLFVAVVLLIPRFLRWIRSQRQQPEPVANNQPPKQEPTGSDQKKSVRQWISDNLSANRGR